MNTEVLSDSADSILRASHYLRQGKIVAVPTETVYGLAANALDPNAVLEVFKAKERPSFDPLIVHVKQEWLFSNAGFFASCVKENILSPLIMKWPELRKIEASLRAFWPGPLTCIFPKGPAIPGEVTSEQPTVGIRCPAHPLFQSLLSQLEFPLAAPSANRFGRISPTKAEHVMQELGGRIPAILDGGECEVGVESTIIRIDSPLTITLLRPGKIGVSELETAFGVSIQFAQTLGEKNQAQEAPGMLDEHYAPTTPLYLHPHPFASEYPLISSLEGVPSGRMGLLSMGTPPEKLLAQASAFRILSSNQVIEEMAHQLFAALRDLDQNAAVDWILCDLPSLNSGLGKAIADRLNRASRNKPLTAPHRS